MRSTAAVPHLTTLIMLSALSVLPVNMFLPSLPNIAEEFGAEYAVVALSIGGYAAVAAAIQLVLGPLSDRYGRRPILLGGLAVFVAASAGCALAGDIRVFLAFRVLQAAVVAGFAVSLAVIRDTTQAERAAGMIGYVSMAWGLAPMLGPLLGGSLDEMFGWRASFWAFVAMGLGVLVLCWANLDETNRSPSPTIAAQFRAYPALLRSRRFWAYALCMTFSTGAFYAFLAGAPLAATAMFDIPPAQLGFYMGTITAGFVVGSFLSGRYASRFPLTTMMIAGRIVACAGLAAGLALLPSGAGHPMVLFGPCMLVGLGNGLTMPSASAGAMSINPELAGSAAGLAGALTVAGGAVIASATGAVLTEENSAQAMLDAMLLSSLAALLATLYVRSAERLDR